MWNPHLVFGCRWGRVGRHNVHGRQEGKGGKSSQLWSNMGLVIQDAGHRGGGFKKASPHAADPEIAFLMPSFAIPAFAWRRARGARL